MRAAILSIRNRLDRAGIVLSGLCAVHCLISVLLVGGLGLGGELLLNPAIHEIGLGLAIFIGVVTLGIGAMRHGAPGPLIIGACGLALMAVALGVHHGPREAVLTVIGVSLVAFAHLRNLRQTS